MTPPFLVIGHVSSRIGLGTTARNFIRILRNKGLQVLAYDVAPGGSDISCSSICVSEAKLPRGAITISILGLDEAAETVLRRSAALHGQALNVGFFWWELTHIPQAWAAALQLFDAHLAGSMFLHGILSRYVGATPVIHARHPLQLGPRPEPERARFGIPAQATVFLTMLDAAAEPARKNPIAAIDAFTAGAAGRPDAFLVVRINTSVTTARSEVLQCVHQRARTDARIRMIEDSLPYSEVMRLMVSCDALISMHRSEGLGLPLLESMSLGRPVIGTDWSGNLDFMTAENAYLVAHRLARVKAVKWSYRLPSVRRHGRWAEPSIGSAAAAVRSALDLPQQRLSLGLQASTDSARYLAHAELASFSDELIRLADAARGITRFDLAVREGIVLPAIQQLEVRQSFGATQFALRSLRQSFDRRLGWRLKKLRAEVGTRGRPS